MPLLEEIIKAAQAHQVRVIIDAAAQLPPKSNLWHYTRDLGADGIIFSGGKFLMAPQSTGLFLGKDDIARHCYPISNPNINIGRPFKVGKEEYAAMYTAVKQFVEADEEQVKALQHRHLDIIESGIEHCPGIIVKRLYHGRIEQDAPMLIVDFMENATGRDCARYLYDHCNPAIDVGHFGPKDPMANASQIFINSINLREDELPHIVESILRFVEQL